MRFLSWITAINVLVAVGFSVAGLVAPHAILPPGSVVTEAAHIFAWYAAARTIPLAIVALILIYKRSQLGLLTLGLLAGIIQLADAGVGLYQHDIAKTVGPLVIAGLQFYAIFVFPSARAQE